MFEGTHISLKKWFYAIYLFISHKKGISSAQLARDIRVTQKTAWFMLGRIRENLRDDDAKFDDDTQVDETYVVVNVKEAEGDKVGLTFKRHPFSVWYRTARFMHVLYPMQRKILSSQLLMNLPM